MVLPQTSCCCLSVQERGNGVKQEQFVLLLLAGSEQNLLLLAGNKQKQGKGMSKRC